MPHVKGTKLDKEHTPDTFQKIENRLAKVAEDIRFIREHLNGDPLDTVWLKLGTFYHHLVNLESLAKQHRGTFEAQVAEAKGKADALVVIEKTSAKRR